ncbi:glycerol uptake facilitator-like aquaporin [Nonomuraea thailandensis]|uniref:Glycerol uptake facilitator-like aquaporin n=1 Tax=Nonomuraea thailandensis TaxID=1188745 RepID=A0A9X2GGI5_9ACTN|nr:MIP/aquaporin family protein [Nonomuraea thailandensis]MCP2358476.1 glycerol uptake facilitator-like aquaporin [Nonomuraea thailandensis]
MSPPGASSANTIARRALAEFTGTAALVAVLVGSGIMAAGLSGDVGVQLLANSLATAAGLAVLITVFAPVSGAHFNPVVSLAAWLLTRREPVAAVRGRDLAAYLPAQTAGAVTGAVLANAMFALPAVQLSARDRSAPHLLLGEAVATAGLIVVVFALARQDRARLAPVAVGGYIGAAYWFTSSTSFANPAVTLGRAVTDTFAGIAPASVPGFIAAQLAGAALGGLLLALLYPATPRPGPAPAPDEVRRTAAADLPR